jgi:hypothetical protein
MPILNSATGLRHLFDLDAAGEEHVHELAVGGAGAQLLNLGELRLDSDDVFVFACVFVFAWMTSLTQESMSCRDRFSVVPLVAYTLTAILSEENTA